MHCIKNPATKDKDTSYSVGVFLSFKPLMLFCLNNDNVQNGTFSQNFHEIENQIFEEGKTKQNTEISKKIL